MKEECYSRFGFSRPRLSQLGRCARLILYEMKESLSQYVNTLYSNVSLFYERTNLGGSVGSQLIGQALNDSRLLVPVTRRLT